MNPRLRSMLMLAGIGGGFTSFGNKLELRQSKCPECDSAVTDLAEVGPHAPKVGGFTICPDCGEFLRFGARLKLHRLTADDKRTLDTNPATVAALDRLLIQIKVSKLGK